MNEINLIGYEKFKNEIGDIETELNKKYNYKINKTLSEKNNCLDFSYGNDNIHFHHYIKDRNTFIYHNFIPNIDKNIIGFHSIIDYFNINLNNGKLYAIIPYINYGYNLFYRIYCAFERDKFLSKLLINSKIDKYITVNNEYFDINNILNSYNERFINIDMVPNLFENISDKENKTIIYFRKKDEELNNIKFKESIVLNQYISEKIKKKLKEIKNCVIFIPIIRDYQLLESIIEYLKNSSIEIVTFGILPEIRLYELIKSKYITKIITNDLIPLSKDLQLLNKLTLVSSLDKIVKKIHEINILT